MKNSLRWIARVFSLQCVSGLAAEIFDREKWLADLERLKTELSRGYPVRRFDSPVQRARRLEGALHKVLGDAR